MGGKPLRSEWDDEEEEDDEDDEEFEGGGGDDDSVSASDDEAEEGAGEEATAGDGDAPAPRKRVPTPEEAAALTDAHLTGGTTYEARAVLCAAAHAHTSSAVVDDCGGCFACAWQPAHARPRCVRAFAATRRSCTACAALTRCRVLACCTPPTNARTHMSTRAQALQASEVLRESALRVEHVAALLAAVDGLRTLLTGAFMRTANAPLHGSSAARHATNPKPSTHVHMSWTRALPTRAMR
jgi:hypothetical protein